MPAPPWPERTPGPDRGPRQRTYLDQEAPAWLLSWGHVAAWEDGEKRLQCTESRVLQQEEMLREEEMTLQDCLEVGREGADLLVHEDEEATRKLLQQWKDLLLAREERVYVRHVALEVPHKRV